MSDINNRDLPKVIPVRENQPKNKPDPGTASGQLAHGGIKTPDGGPQSLLQLINDLLLGPEPNSKDQQDADNTKNGESINEEADHDEIEGETESTDKENETDDDNVEDDDGLDQDAEGESEDDSGEEDDEAEEDEAEEDAKKRSESDDEGLDPDADGESQEDTGEKDDDTEKEAKNDDNKSKANQDSSNDEADEESMKNQADPTGAATSAEDPSAKNSPDDTAAKGNTGNKVEPTGSETATGEGVTTGPKGTLANTPTAATALSATSADPAQTRQDHQTTVSNDPSAGRPIDEPLPDSGNPRPDSQQPERENSGHQYLITMNKDASLHIGRESTGRSGGESSRPTSHASTDQHVSNSNTVELASGQRHETAGNHADANNRSTPPGLDQQDTSYSPSGVSVIVHDKVTREATVSAQDPAAQSNASTQSMRLPLENWQITELLDTPVAPYLFAYYSLHHDRGISQHKNGDSSAVDSVPYASVTNPPVKAATVKKRIYCVFFEANCSELEPDSEQTLEKVAALLQHNPSLKMHVIGHSDNVGEFDYNLDLSRARVHAVLELLSSGMGVNQSRLEAWGVGYLSPNEPNQTATGRANNRRVELQER